jgi:cytochrome c oxidase assembly protein subunit 15
MSDLQRRLRWTWRRYFSALTIVATVILISWGGIVTSIEAGMAVPDWPTSFGSYDPFRTGLYNPDDPSARWWNVLPVLAEHGHRLIGALVGLLTVVLAGWTWWADDRRWMRYLSAGALLLVTLQGLLGGFRVTANSVTLAAVHACTAQIFFALLVALTLFTTPTWRTRRGALPDTPRTWRLRWLSLVAVVALYIQIVLGAVLRHHGQGIDPLFASIHIAGAFAVTGLLLAVFVYVQKHFDANGPLTRATWTMVGAVSVQFALGLAAYVVMLHETQMVQSFWQTLLTVGHLVVGALLMATTVATALLAWRRRLPVPFTRPEAGGDAAAREPVVDAAPPSSSVPS